MQTAAVSIVALVLQWVVFGPAFGQAPADFSPADEMDEDTIVGIIVIALAAAGYWFWKRRRESQASAPKPQHSPIPPLRRGPSPQPDGSGSIEDVQPAWRGTPESTGSVFISYRRGDAGDVVGRIYDRLVDRFGKPHVFKDVDSIPLGVDFRKHLADSVGECRVFLAIISRGWLQQTDGERRIDQPNDFVRIEMEAALQRKIPVIPVLVQGAALPNEQDLPASLRELAYRNAAVVRADPDFNADIVRLMDGITFHLVSDADRVGRARPH